MDLEHFSGKKAITSKRGVKKLFRKAEEGFFSFVGHEVSNTLLLLVLTSLIPIAACCSTADGVAFPTHLSVCADMQGVCEMLHFKVISILHFTKHFLLRKGAQSLRPRHTPATPRELDLGPEYTNFGPVLDDDCHFASSSLGQHHFHPFLLRGVEM